MDERESLMSRRYRRWGGLLLLAIVSPAGGLVAQAGTTAFVHVDVLPMDRERVLEDYTVVVVDGVIQVVEPSHRVEPPSGARIIEGDGLFLVPGLGDMHVRLPGPELSPDQLEDVLFLFLANGITTVRSLPGIPSHLQLKRDIAAGTVLGPTLYLGSPPLDGTNGSEPQTAVDRMLAYRSAGYDFLTIQAGLPLAAWDSVAEEAHSRGYTFGGVVPDAVGLRHALSTGVSFVDYMDGYLREVVADPVRARLDRGESVPLRQLLESAEGRKMRAMAAHTRASDTWVVPTLRLQANLNRPLDPDSTLAVPFMAYVPPQLRERWILQKAREGVEDGETARLLVEVRGQMLRAIALAGAGVLLGSGSPEVFLVPGFSLREEMQSLEEARLTPYEILVTGTRNVAEYAQAELRDAGNFGTVEEGNRADLVLLQGNPFQDLRPLWDPAGVMVRGRWISREEIDLRLARIAEKNQG